MEPSSGSKPAKKVIFEDLPKEELVQKCYHLLDIAQKAKHTKSALQEEIQTLKDELSKIESFSTGNEEILNTLIQKNLALTMTIDKLSSSNTSLSQKLEQTEIELRENKEKVYLLDNENGSFKRQINRLVEENEQLLGNLDGLEKQIEKLNQLGIEQNTQLLHLEKQHFTENNDNAFKDDQIISKNEIEILKSENEELGIKITEFETKLSGNDTTIKELEEELAKKDIKISNLSSKLLELENSINNSQNESEVYQLKTENATMKGKLKLYHSKIVKFAGIVKVLRKDKNDILNLSKSYVDQVQIWKDQLQQAKEKFLYYIKQLEEENQDIKLKLTSLNENQQKILSSFEEDKRNMEEKFKNEIFECTKEIESLNEKYSQVLKLEKQLEDSAEINEKLNLQLNNLHQEITQYKHEIEDLRKERESYQLELKKQQSDQKLVMAEEMTTEMEKLRLNNEEKVKQIEQLINSEEALKSDLKNNLELLEEYKSNLNISEVQKEDCTKQLNEMKNTVVLYENELTNLKIEHAAVCESEKNMLNELKSLKNDNVNYSADIKSMNDKYNLSLEEHSKEKSKYEEELATLRHEMKSYQELEVKSSSEIEKLMQENKALLSEVERLKEELLAIKNAQKDYSDGDCQTELTLSADVEQQISDLKRENADLLLDMNEMNQELKERGENISKLSAHCEEVLKKLQVYEAQANKNVDNITEKEKIIEDLKEEIRRLTSNVNNEKSDEITQLKNEIETLKEKLNQNIDSPNADIETMSTSTISRTDEINRLKDLEGSWEERYGKLRNLAVKLKGKIRELNNSSTQQQSENEDLQKKLSVNMKTIQKLQNKCDSVEDELDKSQKECKIYLNRLNQIAHDISNDKQQLASKDEIINELNQKVEQFNKEKQSTDNWKKQVSAKIQTLRKDLEAKELLRKELEMKIKELNSEMEKKDELIKSESESHDHTKNLLEQLNEQCKKNSMLSLEMQDYERSMNEITKKMDKQQEQVVSLKSQIDSQKAIIEKLKDENKTLQEKVSNEEQNLLSASSEIEMYKSKIGKFGESIVEKADQINSLTKLLESYRAEVEELSIEISKMIAEHQKTDENLKNDRDQLRNQNAILQQNTRDLQDELNMKIAELENVQKDYEGYKIRAQSVLKQNQSRDIGLEEKLLEEINLLKTQNVTLSAELESYKENSKKLEKDIQKIIAEKDTYWKQMKDFESELLELKTQYTQLQTNHEKVQHENAETVRNLKIHTETLSQCYRQQLSEQEKQFSKEITDLKLRLDSVLTSTESLPLSPTIPREEAEGSESTESIITSTHPIPLEKLLESDSSESVDKFQKQLSEQESKVAHLTALLSETEKDLIKHIQMNNLLKEEIRRHQRSVEREKHAENLEYLKNVVVKFVTLSSGDERTRLVPVLNTILKLSPDETKQLNAVAKGESLLKGWSNYLPAWSPGKSQ